MTSEANSYLFAGEEVALVVRPHVITLAKPVMPMLAAVALLAGFPNRFTFLVLLAVFARSGWDVGLWWVDRYVLTTERILSMSGIVTKKVVSLPLAKITDLTYARSVPGRIFGYGSLDLESAGQQDFGRIDFLPDPDHFYREVMALALGPRPGGVEAHDSPAPAASPDSSTSEAVIPLESPPFREPRSRPSYANDAEIIDLGSGVVRVPWDGKGTDGSAPIRHPGLNPDHDPNNTDEIPIIRRSDD